MGVSDDAWAVCQLSTSAIGWAERPKSPGDIEERMDKVGILTIGQTPRPDLEAVFLHLTGRELRD